MPCKQGTSFERVLVVILTFQILKRHRLVRNKRYQTKLHVKLNY